MVSVYGDIQAKDEYTHPLGAEKHFNESMYFNFFDRGQGRGGFLRVGNRANEGYAEVTLCLYLPGGEVMFNYKRPEITGNDAFDAGGMKFEVLEPLARHRTTYEGSAVFLAEPEQMTDPGQAFSENPHRRVSLELVHEGVGPVFGSAGLQREAVDPEREFARAHYEQHMRVRGALAIDGESVEIDGLGLRDHSWGPRYWQALKSYRWLNCTFGPDFGFMVSEICPHESAPIRTGVLVRDGVLERINSVEIDTEYAADSHHHRRISARLGLEGGGRVLLEGDVKGYIPLRNRRAGMVTHIGEGMTEYRCEGRTGLGISEYLEQIDPVG
ncbi:MAG: hypothetical protein Q8Q00_01550 [Dehalococcoidia bacterium]|nr:hypothetical protein [Dehalococcoidia bacterium]